MLTFAKVVGMTINEMCEVYVVELVDSTTKVILDEFDCGTDMDLAKKTKDEWDMLGTDGTFTRISTYDEELS